MKNITKVLSVALLSVASWSSFAAMEVHVQPQDMTQIGTVSDSGDALTLSELNANLAAKAAAAGAKSYQILSAGGNNKYYGSATIYK